MSVRRSLLGSDGSLAGLLVRLGLGSLLAAHVSAGIPAAPHFFAQTVNHSNASDTRLYPQRYYTYENHFRGPGAPIFLILGGEGALEPSHGIMYSVVAEKYAAKMGAHVVSPEHRFYGRSQPLTREEIQQARDEGLPDPRAVLLTADQALRDAVRLVQHVQRELGCALTDRTAATYCPVIAVGGSYPGFLAATIRLRFPTVVDLAYAASAPMKFYSQQTPQFAYYDHISRVAETAVPGCAAAVRETLTQAVQALPTAAEWGLCPATLPAYLQPDHRGGAASVLAQEVVMMVAILFCNSNMGYYPPSPATQLVRVCRAFVAGRNQTANHHNHTAVETVRSILLDYLTAAPHDASCLDVRTQLPTGPHARVSAGDWSGVGSGEGGESWDFQTCSLLVEAIGLGPASMFPPRTWSLAWLTHHCQVRFGVTPTPHRLVKEWHFDEASLANETSYILFTNGGLDGWSVASIAHNVSETVVAVNFATGAHHSDLSGPTDPALNTAEINAGRDRIEALLRDWLAETRVVAAMAS
jgi:hypothetical protein